MVFTPQNGLVNALSDREKKMWIKSYYLPKFKKLQNQVEWGWHDSDCLAALNEHCSNPHALFR
jgi:hypothetical protein